MNGRAALQRLLRNSVRFLGGGTGGTNSACREARNILAQHAAEGGVLYCSQ